MHDHLHRPLNGNIELVELLINAECWTKVNIQLMPFFFGLLTCKVSMNSTARVTLVCQVHDFPNDHF